MKIRYLASVLLSLAALSVSAAVPAPASAAGGGMAWALAPMSAPTVASPAAAVVLTQGGFNATDMAIAGISAASAASDLVVECRGAEIMVRTSSVARWTIYSILGTVVRDGVAAEGATTIQLDGLTPAMYIFRISDSHGASQTMKIIVE